MTISSKSPWLQQFSDLISSTIRSRATVRPEPLSNADYSDARDVVSELDSRIQVLFVPSSELDRILGELILTCYNHARIAYPDTRTFLRRCNTPDSTGSTTTYFPRCVTGIAGLGKTQIFHALQRVLIRQHLGCLDIGHKQFEIQPVWYVSVEENRKLSDILRYLISSVGATPSSTKINDLIQQCRRLAYQYGVLVLIVDEMQSMTRSSQANTMVANVLYDLRRIGLPIVYGANFSLVHRIKSRPHEDVERLLCEPLVLIPEPSHSEDWSNLVRAQIDIAPHLFDIDVDRTASQLYTMTAGSRRLLGRLIVLAAKVNVPKNQMISIGALSDTYSSTAFSANRDNVEALQKQFATGKKVRNDLWCPLSIPGSEEALLQQDAQAFRMEEMLMALQTASMTEDEKVMLNLVREKMRESAEANIEPIGKNASPSSDDFQAGEDIFQNLK